MAKRSEEKWRNQFLISQGIFESISNLDQYNDPNLTKDACVAYRNPVVFDNQVSEAIYVLKYEIDIDYDGSKTRDHLIGTSNIVLYMYKNKLYKKWKTIEDFIQTIRALQVLIVVPKKLNDKGSFKGWQFGVDNIDDCILWHKKLKNEGIDYLLNKHGEKVKVEEVWNEWYQEFKEYLK